MRFVIGDLAQQFVAINSLEDRPQSQQFIEGGSQGVHVAAVIDHTFEG